MQHRPSTAICITRLWLGARTPVVTRPKRTPTGGLAGVRINRADRRARNDHASEAPPSAARPHRTPHTANRWVHGDPRLRSATAWHDAEVPPPRTPDGRWIVVGGRRWRAADPELPEPVRTRLLHHHGTARSAVRTAKRTNDDPALATARARVGAAKRGLGERGTPWWEQ